MSDLFCADMFVPAYVIWLAIRYFGFHETVRLW